MQKLKKEINKIINKNSYYNSESFIYYFMKSDINNMGEDDITAYKSFKTSIILYNACTLSLDNSSIFSEISTFCFNSGFVIKSLYKIFGVIPKKFIKSISVFLLVPSFAVSILRDSLC